MKKNVVGWLFVLPAAAHLAIFAMLPILITVGVSFFRWNLLKDSHQFVGFQNYTTIFQDPGFWRALWNSCVFCLLSVPLGTALALGVALLVSSQVKAMAVFRAIYFLPSVCSQVAIAMTWIYIFLPKVGLINAVFGALHLPAETDFLGNPGWAMAALVFMSLWVSLGPRMVLYVAGLLNIPDYLYEAAELDGASPSTRFWKITLPLLSPTTLFVVLTSTIGALQVFTPVYMMTKGGPDGATDVVGYHIYSAAWERFQMGEAGAMSFVLFVLVLLAAVVQFRILGDRKEMA